jgi:hypothetical protein
VGNLLNVEAPTFRATKIHLEAPLKGIGRRHGSTAATVSGVVAYVGDCLRVAKLSGHARPAAMPPQAGIDPFASQTLRSSGLRGSLLHDGVNCVSTVEA